MTIRLWFSTPGLNLGHHSSSWTWGSSSQTLLCHTATAPATKKRNAKECWKYRTTALISHASKVMLKVLQARLQQYVNRELPDVQAGFRKGRGTRDQIANIPWIVKKATELYWLCQSLTVWITIKCGKFWKRWEYQTTWPASWETCIQVRKQ